MEVLPTRLRPTCRNLRIADARSGLQSFGVRLDPEAVKRIVLANTTSPPPRAVEATVAGLRAGRSVILIERGPSGAGAIAHAVASSASHAGMCEGAISMPTRSARLLTPADLLAECFRDDLWWLIETADEVSLRNAVTYVRMMRPRESWRAVITTKMQYSDVARTVANARVSDFAVIDLT